MFHFLKTSFVQDETAQLENCNRKIKGRVIEKQKKVSDIETERE